MSILTDIVVIIALSTAVVYVFQKLKLPSIVGFLVTGVLAGPGGFGAITEIHAVELFAEVGVILLLFTIGLELSPRDLLRLRKAVLGGGGIQVSITIVSTMLIALLASTDLDDSIFAGFLVALSSTAIVLKSLQESGEIDTPHGRTSLGILIFQDVVIVPMMLLTPLIAGTTGGAPATDLLILLGKSLILIVLVVVAARYVVPVLMHRIAATKNRELFLLFVVTLCFAVAWLTSLAGLSLALGAFIAGLLVADSDYSHYALGNVIPFRDVFTSIFFVSIGMLLDPAFVFSEALPVFLLTLAVVFGKLLLVTVSVLLLRYPIRTALLSGFALAQVGEFSFILSRVGLAEGLISGSAYQMFLAVAVLSMATTPLLMALAPSITTRIADRFNRPVPDETADDISEGALLIIGYGLNGKNLVTAACVAGIPYTVLELNVDTVRRESRNGIHIKFGDATQDAVLVHAGVRSARVIVVAISDAAATARITERVRTLNPVSSIIVRTRFVTEVAHLYSLGADEVIPEEFETALEIFKSVLRRYLLPRHEIENMVAKLRSDGYEALLGDAPQTAATIPMPDLDIGAVVLDEASTAVGDTLRSLDLRASLGVTAFAIVRGKETITNPDPDSPLQARDRLYIMGTASDIAHADEILRRGEQSD